MDAAIQQTSSLPLVEDMSAFLEANSNLQANGVSAFAPTSMTNATENSPALLGQLMQRIQTLRLDNPVWNIEVEPGTERSAQRFIGSLHIDTGGGQKIVLDLVQPGTNFVGLGLPSKKDVKSVLARRALVLLEEVSPLPKKALSQNTTVSSTRAEEGDGINWIGRVLEYTNSLPMAHRSLTYTESSTTPSKGSGPVLFACTLSIAIPTLALPPENQSGLEYTVLKFPSSPTLELFSSKSKAKVHCSRLAGHFLIVRGELSPNGSIPPKAKPCLQATQTNSEQSLASQIPGLCAELGLPGVTYQYTSPSGDPNNAFVNCSAYFQDPSKAFGLPNPIAKAENVFGKNKARDECARILIDVLGQVRTMRLTGSQSWQAFNAQRGNGQSL